VWIGQRRETIHRFVLRMYLSYYFAWIDGGVLTRTFAPTAKSSVRHNAEESEGSIEVIDSDEQQQAHSS